MIPEAEPPLQNSYWVQRGKLLAGEYPGGLEEEDTRVRLQTLVRAGFDTFLDLTQVDEMPAYLPVLAEQARRIGRRVAYHRFSILDRGLPSPAQMTTTLDAIDKALEGGHRIYLHCQGGVGRTGTTVGCFLVRHGSSGQQALEQIAAWWRGVPKSLVFPRSPETDDQVEFILNWNETIRP